VLTLNIEGPDSATGRRRVLARELLSCVCVVASLSSRLSEASDPSRGRLALQLSMLATLVLVTFFAFWDEARESRAQLDDFAAEQATLASGIAAGVAALLPTTTQPPETVDDAAATEGVSQVQRAVLGALARIEHPGESVVMLATPGFSELMLPTGRVVVPPSIKRALHAPIRSLRLNRSEAAALGLPERTAFAGLANLDVGKLGTWQVVSVSTARRERDRASRAQYRLILVLSMASGIVLAFGGVALRKQRKELLLQHELSVLALQRERDERLAHATRAAVMGTFAIGIAHEVSTPLGVILGRAEQLAERVAKDERASRAARAIMEQAEGLKTLVRRFLDLARGGAPTFAQIPSTQVAEGAVSFVDHRFERAGVTLTEEIPERMPLIRCDRPLLEHALVNLLLNACEACVMGGSVHLSAQSDSQQVAFIVTDDGRGITNDDAARATEPFFTTKAEAGGTGLGLAIASEIVKSHHGTLSIQPRIPRGTRACVAIPISSDGESDAT
jgi:two-component system, NtrC family, sensor kinase